MPGIEGFHVIVHGILNLVYKDM